MQKIKVLTKSLMLAKKPDGKQVICITGTYGYCDEKRADYFVGMGDAEYADADDAPDTEPAADPAPEPPAAPAEGDAGSDGEGADTGGLA